MKKLLIAAVVVLGSMLVGCTSVETTGEHGRRYLLTTDLQMRQMVEDWDFFWLMDRKSNLSHWNARQGY